MPVSLPYCGTPPLPGELLGRFNLDPWLIAVLAVLAMLQFTQCRTGRARLIAGLGWGVTAAALLSPLCALSVALFAARVGQHMLLVLVAAPLIAAALKAPRFPGPVPAAAAFFVALWFWHMPRPYGWTFESRDAYWLMHLSLFGTAVLLWRALLQHQRAGIVTALLCGVLSCIQMGLLGALLALANRPLFSAHLLTAPAWGYTALQDQQLGGALMWVPGLALFLWLALRSLARLWQAPLPSRSA